MNRPSGSPLWATDAAYAAGADPWSGQNNKSIPSGGKVGSGATPATDLPAEEYNYMLNNHGQWAAALDSNAAGSNAAFNDEFLYTTNTALQTVWTANNPTFTTIVDDSANGGFGVCKLSSGAGAGANCDIALLHNVPYGSKDWVMAARVRNSASGATNIFQFGMINGPCFGGGGSSPNWNMANSDTSFLAVSSVAWNAASYTNLQIQKVGTTVTWYINGALVATNTFNPFASYTDAFTFLNDDPAGMGASIQSLWWLDAAKLWIGR
jgi:hypothetical protein